LTNKKKFKFNCVKTNLIVLKQENSMPFSKDDKALIKIYTCSKVLVQEGYEQNFV